MTSPQFLFTPGYSEANTKQELTSVGLTYIHTWWSYVHTPLDFAKGASLAWRLHRHIAALMFICRWAWPTHWPIRSILGFWGAKFPKMGDSLPGMPMNRRAKHDAASVILGG